MNWTFIICTHDPNQERVDISIQTIDDLLIPNYEVIVIGGIRKNKSWPNRHVKFVDFNESVRPGWTTKKKNDAAKIAKYENLCILHDYFAFDSEWYKNWLLFEKENHVWNVACNQILLVNGKREWTDWITWKDPEYGSSQSLPYTDWSRTRYQYISGGYFCIKREFFLKNLFSEQLGSHEHEDIEWSERLSNEWSLVCNHHSIVRHTKWHRDANHWRKHEKRMSKLRKE